LKKKANQIHVGQGTFAPGLIELLRTFNVSIIFAQCGLAINLQAAVLAVRVPESFSERPPPRAANHNWRFQCPPSPNFVF
jgi:hypothetical protein